MSLYRLSLIVILMSSCESNVVTIRYKSITNWKLDDVDVTGFEIDATNQETCLIRYI